MIKVKYCVNCVYAIPERESSWNLSCTHPIVNAKDAWALASKYISGTSCRAERELSWYQLPACGKSGKLWEEAMK